MLTSQCPSLYHFVVEMLSPPLSACPAKGNAIDIIRLRMHSIIYYDVLNSAEVRWWICWCMTFRGSSAKHAAPCNQATNGRVSIYVQCCLCLIQRACHLSMPMHNQGIMQVSSTSTIVAQLGNWFHLLQFSEVGDCHITAKHFWTALWGVQATFAKESGQICLQLRPVLCEVRAVALLSTNLKSTPCCCIHPHIVHGVDNSLPPIDLHDVQLCHSVF